MKPIQIKRVAALCAALALGGASSHAQPVPDKIAAPATEKATIRVKNMPVSFMAYWLDPTRQPVPISIQLSRANGGTNLFEPNPLPRQPGNGNGPRDLKLPDGIGSIVAVEPQNGLVARGTAVGIAALRKLVAELDVAIEQVQIEAQIIEMSPARLQSLPLVFRDVAITDNDGNVEADNFFARTAFAAPTSDRGPILKILNEGLADDSARVITAPRVTAIDGLTAKLSSTERRTLLFGEAPRPETAATKQKETEKAMDMWAEGLTFVDSETGLRVTPLLHGDVMNLSFQITLDNMVTSGSTIMRDGQTFAVRLPNANPRTGWPRVALITARLIRRAGDENNVIVPGT